MNKREYIFWIFLVFFLGTIFVFTNIRYGFVADSLLKAIQAYSLVHNSFMSEELFYPGRIFDPDFKYYIFQDIFLVKSNGRFLGVFPLFFSLFLSPFTIFPGIPFLSIITISIFLGILVFLRYYWKLSVPVMLFVSFATYYLPLSLDMSENSLFIFLNILGISLLLSGFEKEKLIYLISGGILSGISVWLRLEVIPFMLVFFLSALYVNGLKNRKTYRKIFTAGIAFSFPVVLFMIFNYWDYGHILGPRFFENFEINNITIQGQIQRLLILAFFGYMKIGFFLYIPLFLIVVIYYLFPKNFKQLPVDAKILYLSGSLFIPLSGLLAPNDGVANAGPRYLELSIFPFIIVATHFWKKIYTGDEFRYKKILLFLNRSAVVFSITVTFFTITVFAKSADFLLGYIKIFESTKTDVWIFSGEVCGFTGLDYFEKPVLCIHSENELDKLVDRLASQAPEKTIGYFRRSGEVVTPDTFEKQIIKRYKIYQSGEEKNIKYNLYSL